MLFTKNECLFTFSMFREIFFQNGTFSTKMEPFIRINKVQFFFVKLNLMKQKIQTCTSESYLL